ncbi:MAG: type II toxin-antitoxin system RelE/ParE family toxin [Cyclobacteriaceae bacterium]
MIESFGCKYTEKVWKAERTKKWSDEVVNRALRKMFMLNAATDIKDLMIPPSNKLHKLRGNFKDYWSVSINVQWRLIFKWEGNNAHEVQVIDYH